ncbi:unnamed protein product [Linum tenue]|uniref:Uncharacterized protein n=1 Tax=Linum tenue TaxID=586396 RepID=A0AAV0ICD5_9ROSI|nr:unnamed protein product [Linum tenue]
MTASEEPILSRLDRLDNMLRQLEEIKAAGSGRSSPPTTTTTSSPSTPSSWTAAASSQVSFADSSPRSRCRPLESVMVEVGMKGSLMDRIHFVEDRMLKVEEELTGEERRMSAAAEEEEEVTSPGGSRKKKGLKGLVRKIIKGNHHHHHNHNHLPMDHATHSKLGATPS